MCKNPNTELSISRVNDAERIKQFFIFESEYGDLILQFNQNKKFKKMNKKCTKQFGFQKFEQNDVSFLRTKVTSTD